MKNLIQKLAKFQKPAVWLLIAANVALAGGYTYAVNRTVFNVVATQKSQKALASTSAIVSDLESHAFALKNGVTLDFAYAQGFEDVSGKQIYITKKSTNNSLSFNSF